MRNDRVAEAVYAAFLIFALSVSLVTSSFICMANAYDPKSTNVEADVNLSDLVQPIIYHPNMIDKDFDGIQDRLEVTIAKIIANESAVLPVVITLYNPVSSRDLDWFVTLGGHVTHVYQHVTYGFAGVIPAANILTFAGLEKGNLCVIEHDEPIRYHLDVSVPLIRARPLVWDTYGYTGSSNQSIAIIDTGIDDSHPDVGPFGDLNFSRKIVGWYDATTDNATTPQDYGEHGTHVAGIAAGTGAANTLQGSDEIETTFTYILPPEKPGPLVYGYVDYIDVTSPGVIELNCSWGGTNNVLMVLSSPAGEVARASGTSQPLILTYDTNDTSHPTGLYEVFVGNVAGPSGTPFSCLETYPYQGPNDGYNLFTGVAPNSKLVGVKVFDNAGSGTTSTVMAGMDWVIENRMTYRIVVASMSIGLQDGAVDTTLDQKADTLVKYGVVTTVSAGNDFPDYTIGSPGTAAYVITVAATNDQNGITSYSGNGDVSKNEFGLIKPDVAAPGGTFQEQLGNKIVSADSNDLDAGYTGYADRNANDYQQMAGTSMSTPHVAGLAALIIEAFGGWNWTQDEALKVKMLICMTAFEVQSGEESNVPPLNRGEKDDVEGYGRISADAAIEAVAMNYSIGELANDTLGFNPSDKKVWARPVSLSAGNKYEFRLSVPSDADYDLYLYSGNPDSYGQPVILEKSVNASNGAEETIEYIPTSSGTYYIVVKWVGGGGAFNLQSRTLVCDVTVVDVVPSATQAYAGWLVNITVMVKNGGGATETFNVTAKYENTTFGILGTVGTQEITELAPGAYITLTFGWNTTDVQPCVNYTIKAEANTVPGETETSDNTYTDGNVEVKMPGDVDGDGDVDIADLSLIARALGTDPTWPHGTDWDKWNPDCDMNGDGEVDVFDLFIAGKHYGENC